MGSVTKETGVKNCTTINLSRAAYINLCDFFFFFLSSPFAICCLLCSAALEEYNVTVASSTLPPDIWAKQEHTVLNEEMMLWTKRQKNAITDCIILHTQKRLNQFYLQDGLSNLSHFQGIHRKPNNYLRMISISKGFQTTLRKLEASKDTFLEKQKSENVALHNSQAGDIEVWDEKRNMVINLWINAQTLHLLIACLLLPSILIVVNVYL